MSALGIMFKRQYTPNLLPDFARRAEAVGFDEVWVIEDCFYAAGIAQAATALAYTESIKVGLGIMPAVARNAAFTALEIASLAHIAPQRFLPGMGHGVGAWMKQIGAFPKSQLKALEEHTIAVRAILRGGEITVDGDYVKLDKVALEYPLESENIPPIQLGVRGEKSLHLSGRVADGTILAEGCSPAYVKWAREHIDMGRMVAKNTDSHCITVYIYWSMDEDETVAKERVLTEIVPRVAVGKTEVYFQPLGIADAVTDMLAEGGTAYLHQNFPDEWLHQLAVVGSPEACAATIQQFYAVGVDTVVLVPMMDNAAALNTYAGQVIEALG